MKTIGLIGGMSWESSSEYYRLINEGMKARLGGHSNARSIMTTLCFEEVRVMQYEGRWDALGELMAQTARQLEAGGADFVVLCTNTMHKLTPAIEAAIDVPFLHIADPTAQAVRQAGLTRVCLLGTRFTMEQEFLRERLERKHGLEVITPDEADRAVVHDIIYDELCHGVVRDEARVSYQRIIERARAAGAQAVILGCTEISLLIKPADSVLPVFDTTELHARAAVAMALSDMAGG